MTVPLEDEPREPAPVQVHEYAPAPAHAPVRHLYQAYVQTIVKMVYSADCEITSVASLKGGCCRVLQHAADSNVSSCSSGDTIHRSI